MGIGYGVADPHAPRRGRRDPGLPRDDAGEPGNWRPGEHARRVQRQHCCIGCDQARAARLPG
jgi:hypothetical protein